MRMDLICFRNRIMSNVSLDMKRSSVYNIYNSLDFIKKFTATLRNAISDYSSPYYNLYIAHVICFNDRDSDIYKLILREMVRQDWHENKVVKCTVCFKVVEELTN